MATTVILLFSILALNLLSNVVVAFDPSPLQDLCVADLASTVRFNGYPCLDPAKVEAGNFFYSGLDVAGNTSNPIGAVVSGVGVSQMPGLNTLGFSMARLDYEVKGFFPPHFHARGSEIHTVLEGSIEVGFVTSSPSFKFYSKVLKRGDVFIVPIGLVHYQRNVHTGKSVSLAVLNSQNPGTTVIPNAVFGSNPDMDTDFLARSFALDRKTVEYLQRTF